MIILKKRKCELLSIRYIIFLEFLFLLCNCIFLKGAHTKHLTEVTLQAIFTMCITACNLLVSMKLLLLDSDTSPSSYSFQILKS